MRREMACGADYWWIRRSTRTDIMLVIVASLKYATFLASTIVATAGEAWTRIDEYQLRIDLWSNLPLSIHSPYLS
ncbi:hypothetical protein TNCV_10761 [Trichonephila clavipes]|nr:hypothetical protein TNCV_10761 [Trichonephila clavipes]